jgi:hypothetical protein
MGIACMYTTKSGAKQMLVSHFSTGKQRFSSKKNGKQSYYCCIHVCFFMSHCWILKSYLTSTLMILCPLYALQGEPPSCYKLAVSIIQNCAEKLEPYVCGFQAHKRVGR